jgi:hypothetical protein
MNGGVGAIMRRSYKLLVLTGSILVIAAVAFYFNGLQGEVFLVTKEGHALPAPGASIQMFRDEGKRSFHGFLSAKTPVQSRHISRLSEQMRDENGLLEAIAKRKRKPEVTDAIRELRELLNQRAASNLQRYCQEMETEAVKYFGRPNYETYADRNGKFSLKLTPGTYTILVKGQAGTSHALWTESIRLVWRSNVRIVDPQCQYSME